MIAYMQGVMNASAQFLGGIACKVDRIGMCRANRWRILTNVATILEAAIASEAEQCEELAKEPVEHFFLNDRGNESTVVQG